MQFCYFQNVPNHTSLIKKNMQGENLKKMLFVSFLFPYILNLTLRDAFVHLWFIKTNSASIFLMAELYNWTNIIESYLAYITALFFP